LAGLGSGAPQSLAIRRSRYQGKPSVILSGGDSRGLMYAALDTAERAGWSAAGGDPFARVRDVSEQPYLVERGVSMYTMQRAYFESRLYDEKHWERYFDMLAASRINNFILIFGYENGGFMAPLYPYFFNLPDYPGVELVGITPAQQAWRRSGADARSTAAGIWFPPRRRPGRSIRARRRTRTSACGPGLGRDGGQPGRITPAAPGASSSLPSGRHPVQSKTA
jgi:hypothetical protein